MFLVIMVVLKLFFELLVLFKVWYKFYYYFKMFKVKIYDRFLFIMDWLWNREWYIVMVIY